MIAWSPLLPENEDLRLHPFVPGDGGRCGVCGVVQSGHAAPWVHLVPRGFQENLAFRKRCLDLSRETHRASALRKLCAEDFLFYINAFVWTYDPRRQASGSVLPFITWAYQDEVLFIIDHVWGQEDLGIEKSRDMGGSWLTIVYAKWRADFRRHEHVMMVSRVEDLVDKSGSPDCMFWKMDFIQEYLPSFLRPGDAECVRQKLLYQNLGTGSVVTGCSTTSDAGRGGRCTAILLDEFAAVEDGFAMCAATRDNSRCRVFVSTHMGAGTAFYAMMKVGIRTVRLHWSLHPLKSEGLYTDARGKLRSPWYDQQCLRASHPTEISQELDIDVAGSAYPFFDLGLLEDWMKRDARPPLGRGELVCNPPSTNFVPSEEGKWLLWKLPDQEGRMPSSGTFVVSVDVAFGTGCTNSVIIVSDAGFKCMVAEFCNPGVSPEELAELAVAACRWFKGGEQEGAWLIWEANGPGRVFGDRVMALRYSNVYYRRGDGALGKITDQPGWYTTKNSKLGLLSEFRRAVHQSEFIVRSAAVFRECQQYAFMPSNEVAHTGSRGGPDPSGAREGHSDRVIAAALGWQMIQTIGPVQRERDAPSVPINCFLSRRNSRKELAHQTAEEAW